MSQILKFVNCFYLESFGLIMEGYLRLGQPVIVNVESIHPISFPLDLRIDIRVPQQAKI